MSIDQLQIYLPYAILAVFVVLLILLISFYRNHILVVALTSVSFILSFIFLKMVPAAKTNLLSVDGLSMVFTGLSLASAFAVTLISYGYFRSKNTENSEFYILLILATLGSIILISSSHFISIFLGLEILSISLYILIAYLRDSVLNVEAGIKYLVLAASSSAFMLFGMSLLYAETGTMSFAELSQKLVLSSNTPLLFIGFCLTLIGIGFKLALVPFHAWTPDVYEGAPAPVSGYIATVSKGAAFAVLMKFFTVFNIYKESRLMLIFYVFAVASMFIGNILAIRQDNIKRILAYSSIAHIGYLLVALIAGGNSVEETVVFYLFSYFITSIAAFGIIASVSRYERDADSMDDYRGLFWKRPMLGAFFSISLLSLAGIPLTAGFIGKFYIALSGVLSGQWILVAVLIFNSVIGLYYYLRIFVVLYEKPSAIKSLRKSLPVVAVSGFIILAILTIFIVWIGIYPRTLIDFINKILALYS